MPDSDRIDKKLILHIGLHKTGTTAIQVGLDQHADFLREQDYSPAVMHTDLIFLHEAFNPKAYGKTRQCIDHELVRRRFRKWAQQQSAANILLSGEAMSLFLWNAGGVNDEVGSSLLDGFRDTKIIVYVRRQDRFIESTYFQWVKTGYKARFDAFLNGPDPDMLHILDWHRKAHQIQDVFPDAQLVVKLYEQSIEGGDIFRDFLRSVSIGQIPDNITSSHENQSLRPAQIALLRLCNEQRDAEHRDALLQAMQADELPGGYKIRNAQHLDDEERARLLEIYHDTNARLFADYDLGELATWEKIEAKSSMPHIRDQELNERAALEMIDQVYARSQQQL